MDSGFTYVTYECVRFVVFYGFNNRELGPKYPLLPTISKHMEPYTCTVECMRNYTVFNFIRFTIIIVYSLLRLFFVCMHRFTKYSNYDFLGFAYKHTAFESYCSVAFSYLLPFSFINMSTVLVNNITWNAGDVERLLHAIITAGAHLKTSNDDIPISPSLFCLDFVFSCSSFFSSCS